MVKWIDSSEVNDDNVEAYLSDVDGILVPGGFGFRASEGKIAAIRYARENNIPFFGICLGMQLATVEFARHVLGYEGAHSAELDPSTPYPIIDLLPEQKDIEDLGGTLRLGLYPATLKKVHWQRKFIIKTILKNVIVIDMNSITSLGNN